MIKVINPEYIGLLSWAAALVYDYPEEELPILESEEKFDTWAGFVAGTGIFQRANIPTPATITGGEGEEKWRKWARRVYNIMSDEYNLPKNEV